MADLISIISNEVSTATSSSSNANAVLKTLDSRTSSMSKCPLEWPVEINNRSCCLESYTYMARCKEDGLTLSSLSAYTNLPQLQITGTFKKLPNFQYL